MEILSPKGHDLLRCMDDQKKKSVNHYRPLPTMFETGRGCANYDTPSFGVEIRVGGGYSVTPLPPPVPILGPRPEIVWSTLVLGKYAKHSI